MFGYRQWRLDSSGMLHSPYAQHIWTAKNNRAVCQNSTDKLLHSKDRLLPSNIPCPNPPAVDCKCGFYAFPNLETVLSRIAWDNVTNCFGIVWMGGTTIIHTDGVARCEYMDIVAIAVVRYIDLPDDYEYFSGFTGIVERKIGLTEADAQLLQQRFLIPINYFEHMDNVRNWLLEKQEAYERRNHLFEPLDLPDMRPSKEA